MLEQAKVKELYIDNLKSVALELRRVPSSSDFSAKTLISIKSVVEIFGSYNNLVRAAGFMPRPSHSPLTSFDLIVELQEIAKKLGRTPTKKEWREESKRSYDTFRNYFGTWKNFIVAAKLPVVRRPRIKLKELPEELMIKDLLTIAKLLEKSPTAAEYNLIGKFNSHQMASKFGSWKKALEAAGLRPNTKGRQFKYHRRIETDVDWDAFLRRPRI